MCTLKRVHCVQIVWHFRVYEILVWNVQDDFVAGSSRVRKDDAPQGPGREAGVWFESVRERDAQWPFTFGVCAATHSRVHQSARPSRGGNDGPWNVRFLGPMPGRWATLWWVLTHLVESCKISSNFFQIAATNVHDDSVQIHVPDYPNVLIFKAPGTWKTYSTRFQSFVH